MRLFNYNLTTSLTDSGSFQFTRKHVIKTNTDTQVYEHAHTYRLHGTSKTKFRLKYRKPSRRGAQMSCQSPAVVVEEVMMVAAVIAWFPAMTSRDARNFTC